MSIFEIGATKHRVILMSGPGDVGTRLQTNTAVFMQESSMADISQLETTQIPSEMLSTS